MRRNTDSTSTPELTNHTRTTHLHTHTHLRELRPCSLSPLSLDAAGASDWLVAAFALSPAADGHVHRLSASVHAADRGVAPCARAPGVT